MTDIDLRVVKTLDNIDNALLNNLTDLTFAKITVDSLCKAARINRSTFYKYYKDKYDLLDKYIDKTLSEFSKNVTTEFVIGTQSELEALAYSNNFKKLLLTFHKNKKIYNTLWHASIERNVYDEMTNIIKRNILNNLNTNFTIEDEKKEYINLFSYLFASEIMIIVKWWLNLEDHISIDDVVKLTDQTTSHGLFITLKDILK